MGICRSILGGSIVNVLSLDVCVDVGYAISGECVPTGISSYPDEYHYATAPDWGT